MNLRKILTLVSCVALLVCISVGATLAYLTATTTQVVNTFTVGKVEIELDETDVDLYGVKDGGTRVKMNDYKLIPGHTYTKDPTVHVKEGSEPAFVFVKVTNPLKDIIDEKTIETQMEENGWVSLEGETNVYFYKDVVDARKEQQDLYVFKEFKVKADQSGAALSAYKDKTIVIDAFAIQEDGFENAQAAWKGAALSNWE